MKFDKILEFQKYDMEYMSIEDALRNSRERALFYSLKSKQSDVQGAKEKSEADAKDLLSQEETLRKRVEKLSQEIEEIDGYIEKASDTNEIEYYSKQLSTLFDALVKLQSKLEKDMSRADSISLSFNMADDEKKKTDLAFKKAESAYQKIMKEKENEAKPYFIKLMDLKKQILPEFMKLYKPLRANKKLPAFVQYDPEEKRCGRCFMDIASDTQTLLKKPGDYTECPNCHRVLFIPD